MKGGITATHAYVGYCTSCGHMVAASVDVGTKRRVNGDIAAFVRDGYRVERVTLEAARAGLTASNCECRPREGQDVRAEQVDLLPSSQVAP